jgi:hypothetical protein
MYLSSGDGHRIYNWYVHSNYPSNTGFLSDVLVSLSGSYVKYDKKPIFTISLYPSVVF